MRIYNQVIWLIAIRKPKGNGVARILSIPVRHSDILPIAASICPCRGIVHEPASIVVCKYAEMYVRISRGRLPSSEGKGRGIGLANEIPRDCNASNTLLR